MNKNQLCLVIAALIFSVIALINSLDKADGSSQSASLEVTSKLKENSDYISELEKNVNLLSNHVENLEESIKTKQDKAWFSPENEGFQIVETTYGKFLIQVSSINKYADGYKIRFSIGNPLNLNIQNYKIIISYNKRYDEKDDASKWIKEFKKTKKKIPNTLLTGSWNYVDVIISPAQKSDIGSLVVSLDFSESTIFLR